MTKDKASPVATPVESEAEEPRKSNGRAKRAKRAIKDRGTTIVKSKYNLTSFLV